MYINGDYYIGVHKQESNNYREFKESIIKRERTKMIKRSIKLYKEISRASRTQIG